MIRAVLRTICAILVLIGLAWTYTLFYGGPFAPFFAWLTHILPPNLQYNPVPNVIKPIAG
jgi:hypothetical protein